MSPLASRRPTGPTTVNSKKADTNTVNIGDNNSFTVLGTFLSKNLSNLATTNPIIKAIMIPP